MKADGFCFLPTIFSSSQVNSARDALWDVIQGKYETRVEPEERFWSIGDDPESIIVPGTLYGFSGTYQNSSTLVPGQGYWLNASGGGEVHVSAGGAARTSFYSFTDLTKKANTLSFNEGNLYFGISIPDEEMLSYQLPPKPPTGMFDVRFVGARKMVETSGTIEIMNNTQDLSISYSVSIDAGDGM